MYGNRLFIRGDMHGILLIRPRPTPLKKDASDDESNGDKSKKSHSSMPNETLLLLGNRDDQVSEVQEPLVRDKHHIILPPLLTTFMLERREESSDNRNDDATPEKWQIDPLKCTTVSNVAFDTLSPGPCCHSDTTTAAFTATTQNENLDFDLFDSSLSDIQFCQCDGCGNCFTGSCSH